MSSVASSNTEEPCYPEYERYSTRLKTFDDFPRINDNIAAEDLAEAGFFVSHALSQTKSALYCFHCNLFLSENRLRGLKSPVRDLHNNISCAFANQVRSQTEKVTKVMPMRTAPPPPPLPPKKNVVLWDPLNHDLVNSQAIVEEYRPPVPPRLPPPSSTASSAVQDPVMISTGSLLSSTVSASDPLRTVQTSNTIGTADNMNAALSPSHIISGLDDTWDDLSHLTDDYYDAQPFAIDETPSTRLLAESNMDTYEARLATFVNWPADNPQDPKTFAKYGMFYTGQSDRTQCYSCGLVVWGWEPYKGNAKAPLRAHKKFYRDCKLLHSRNWADAAAKLNPVGPLINWDKADAPHMIADSVRLDTYKLLLAFSGEKAKVLADSGFYLTADGKNVKCFYCGVTSSLASIGDPWITHAQLQPRCTFLSRKKGPLFVRKASRKKSESELVDMTDVPDSADLEAANSAQSSPASGVKNFFLQKVLPIGTRLLQKAKAIEESAMITTVIPPPTIGHPLLSGFKANSSGDGAASVAPTISPAASSGMLEQPEVLSRHSLAQLFNTTQVTVNLPPRSPIPASQAEISPQVRHKEVSKSEEFQKSKEKVKERAKEKRRSDHEKLARSKAFRNSLDIAISMGFTSKQIDAALHELSLRGHQQAPTVESLVQLMVDLEESKIDGMVISESEGSSLAGTTALRNQDQRMCVICMEEVANFAFVPCGHVETCAKCSKAVDTCPMCRQPIRDRIRIYL